MASLPIGRWGLARLASLTLLGSGAALAASPVSLEAPKLAVPAGAEATPLCPRLQSNDPAAIQPLRLDPRTVAIKNRIGCLSMQDAIYGADGCPRRLCGDRYANPIQLPGGGR